MMTEANKLFLLIVFNKVTSKFNIATYLLKGLV